MWPSLVAGAVRADIRKALPTRKLNGSGKLDQPGETRCARRRFGQAGVSRRVINHCVVIIRFLCVCSERDTVARSLESPVNFARRTIKADIAYEEPCQQRRILIRCKRRRNPPKSATRRLTTMQCGSIAYRQRRAVAGGPWPKIRKREHLRSGRAATAEESCRSVHKLVINLDARLRLPKTMATFLQERACPRGPKSAVN